MAGWMICAAQNIEVSGVPAEIRILPLGRVHSQKGDFTVDDESVELIRNHFKERRLDLVIDYEHQTLADVQAPAGGWIKDIYKGNDALIAKVEWTPKAAEYLKNKEYRYLSPVVLVRKKDQKATAIHSVALTNTPAIDGMFAIVNSLDIEDGKGGMTMDLLELAKLLGLPEGATEEQVKAAAAEAAKAAARLKEYECKEGEDGKDAADGAAEPAANKTILSMLNLKEGAKTEDVAAAIMALKTGDAGLAQEVKALKEKLQQQEVDEVVEKALKGGKITAAMAAWAKEYALKDMDGFKSYMEKVAPVVPQGKLELKDAPKAETEETDMAILKECGVSKEDYEKYYRKGE